MEPERKIEKQLRAFAKKRREQAGDAMELRPAARQRLHSEIRRRSQQPNGGFLSSLFTLSRPKLAFAFCVLAIVCAGVWLLVPLSSDRKSSDTLSLASANTRRTAKAPVDEEAKSLPAGPPLALEPPAPASQPAPAAPPVPQPVSIAPGSLANSATAPTLPEVAMDRLSPANDAGASHKVENETTLSYQTERRPAPLATDQPANLAGALNRNEAGAKGSATTDSGLIGSRLQPTIAPASPMPNPSTTSTNFAFAMNQGSSHAVQAAATMDKDFGGQVVMAPAATTTAIARQRRSLWTAGPGPAEAPATLAFQNKAASPPKGAVAVDDMSTERAASTGMTPSQLFYRLDLPAARERAILALQNPAPILASFRVEQNGRELRVLDADGSVYTGMVQIADYKKSLDETSASTLKAESVAAAAKPGPRVQPQLALQNYTFVVSGTNRNLKQLVTFSGSFIPLTNAGSLWTNSFLYGAGGAGGGGGGAMPSLPAQLLFDSRISGKAVIGAGKEIEVNAAPERR